jgi:hypothetical protein
MRRIYSVMTPRLVAHRRRRMSGTGVPSDTLTLRSIPRFAPTGGIDALAPSTPGPAALDGEWPCSHVPVADPSEDEDRDREVVAGNGCADEVWKTSWKPNTAGAGLGNRQW